MRPTLLALTLLLPAFACRRDVPPPPAAVDSTPPAAMPSEPWSIRLDGVGLVTYGMSLSEARAALGDSLPVDPPTATCGYVVPRGAPPGLRLMVEAGKVVRADVDSAGVPTDAGVEVGTSEADVRSRYSDGLRVQPHKYDPKGRYLIVQGTGPADSARRLIFETDGQRVVRFRAGITPAVEYVERCA